MNKLKVYSVAAVLAAAGVAGIASSAFAASYNAGTITADGQSITSKISGLDASHSDINELANQEAQINAFVANPSETLVIRGSAAYVAGTLDKLTADTTASTDISFGGMTVAQKFANLSEIRVVLTDAPSKADLQALAAEFANTKVWLTGTINAFNAEDLDFVASFRYLGKINFIFNGDVATKLTDDLAGKLAVGSTATINGETWRVIAYPLSFTGQTWERISVTNSNNGNNVYVPVTNIVNTGISR